MGRAILALLIWIAPALLLASTVGCKDKTVTVQQSEQRQESEPDTASPGQDVVK
jgi:hypothetical protein